MLIDPEEELELNRLDVALKPGSEEGKSVEKPARVLLLDVILRLIEDDDEELVNWLLEDDELFIGGTKVVKTGAGLAVETPLVDPLDELIRAEEEDVEVLNDVEFDVVNVGNAGGMPGVGLVVVLVVTEDGSELDEKPGDVTDADEDDITGELDALDDKLEAELEKREYLDEELDDAVGDLDVLEDKLVAELAEVEPPGEELNGVEDIPLELGSLPSEDKLGATTKADVAEEVPGPKLFESVAEELGDTPEDATIALDNTVGAEMGTEDGGVGAEGTALALSGNEAVIPELKELEGTNESDVETGTKGVETTV
jgi:hypothetical protein